MLQVTYIKANRAEVLKRLAKKNFSQSSLVDTIIAHDDERKKLQYELDEIQSKINSTSKEIGQLMAKGKKGQAEEKKLEVATLKTFLQPVSEKLSAVEKNLQDDLVKLPNLPHHSVPEGKTPEENEILREGGAKPALYKGAIPHWDLAKKYDLINFELGNKVTGAGFPFYKNKGAKLQRALIQYFLEGKTAAGYTEYEPPLMVN